MHHPADPGRDIKSALGELGNQLLPSADERRHSWIAGLGPAVHFVANGGNEPRPFRFGLTDTRLTDVSRVLTNVIHLVAIEVPLEDVDSLNRFQRVIDRLMTMGAQPLGHVFDPFEQAHGVVNFASQVAGMLREKGKQILGSA
jgi:hypothetical protein